MKIEYSQHVVGPPSSGPPSSHSGGGVDRDDIMYVRTTNLDDKENLHRVYGTYIPFSSSPFPLLG